jgi:hypothetical protein
MDRLDSAAGDPLAPVGGAAEGQVALAEVRRLLQEGYPAEALARLRAVLPKGPRDAESCLLAMQALTASGRIDEAIATGGWWRRGQPANLAFEEAFQNLMLQAGYLPRADGRARQDPGPATHPAETKPVDAPAATVNAPATPPASSVRATPVCEKPAAPAPAAAAADLASHGHAPRLHPRADPLDASDLLSIAVVLGHAALLIGLVGWSPTAWQDHPLPGFLAEHAAAFGALTGMALPWEVLLIPGFLVPTLWCVDRFGRQIDPDYVLVHESLQRPWAYHGRFFGFLLLTTASLWANSLGDRPLVPELPVHGRDLALVFGLAACVPLIACVWVLLPGARWRFQLLKEPAEKRGSVLCVRRLLPPTVDYYYPGDFKRARARFTWIGVVLTGTGHVDLLLTNGTRRRFVGPTSLARLEPLARNISRTLRECKVIPDASSKGEVHDD